MPALRVNCLDAGQPLSGDQNSLGRDNGGVGMTRADDAHREAVACRDLHNCTGLLSLLGMAKWPTRDTWLLTQLRQIRDGPSTEDGD